MATRQGSLDDFSTNVTTGEMATESDSNKYSASHCPSEDGSSGGDWIAKYYEAWVASMRANSPENTWKPYKANIDRLVALTGVKDPRKFNVAVVQRYLDTLPGRRAQELALCAIRSYIAVATEGRVTIPGKLLRLKARTRNPWRVKLTVAEREAMILAANTEEERVFLSTIRDLGCRATNAVEIETPQCSLGTAPYHVSIVAADTKNKRPATPRLTHRTRDMLVRWIGTRTGRVFPNMTYDKARRLLRRVAAKAGIEKHVTLHAFRHSRAYDFGDLYRKGKVSGADVMNHFGWSDLKMFLEVYAQDTPNESLERLEEVDKTLEDKPMTEIDINKAMDLLSKGLITKDEFDQLTGLVPKRKRDRGPMMG